METGCLSFYSNSNILSADDIDSATEIFKDVKIATRLYTPRRITFMQWITDGHEQSCLVDDVQFPLSFGTHM